MCSVTAKMIFFPFLFFSDNRIYLCVCSYIRDIKMQMEEEDNYMNRGVRTSMGTMT